VFAVVNISIRLWKAVTVESVYSAQKSMKNKNLQDPWRILFDQMRAEGGPFLTRHLARINEHELFEWGQESARLAKKSKNYVVILKACRNEWKRRHPVL
jgi:hypothetical protein